MSLRLGDTAPDFSGDTTAGPIDFHRWAGESWVRNFDEILRVIDSLRLADAHRVATPVNWKQGEDVIIVPAVTDEEAPGKFPKGWKALKPYLRLTPPPDR